MEFVEETLKVLSWETLQSFLSMKHAFSNFRVGKCEMEFVRETLKVLSWEKF